MKQSNTGISSQSPEYLSQEGWGPGLEFVFKPMDNPDWGHARNRHCVLMVASAEWSQGAVSEVVCLGGSKYLLSPSRDWPYEGVFAYTNGENWKYIDTVMLAFQGDDGEFLQFKLMDSMVRISPWKSTYEYLIQLYRDGQAAGQAHTVLICYYLHTLSEPGAISGYVEISSPDGLVWDNGSVRPVLQPFLDIRHMYRESCPLEAYNVELSSTDVWITAQGKAARFFADGLTLSEFGEFEEMRRVYRLGSGDRAEVGKSEADGQYTAFVPQDQQTVAGFAFQPRFNSSTKCAGFLFCCGEPEYLAKTSFASLETVHRQSQHADAVLLMRVETTFGGAVGRTYRNEILARIVAHTRYKVHTQKQGQQAFSLLPVAGGFWFKTPWYRDIFEGIINSFSTLSRLDEEMDVVKAVIVAALQGQDPRSGRIMTRIPESLSESPCYHNSDATLLAFLVATRYLAIKDDKPLALFVLQHFQILLQAFSRQVHEDSPCLAPDGPPWIDQTTGLLASAPSHGWIDTEAQQVHIGETLEQGFPSRFSRHFLRQFIRLFGTPEDCRHLLRSPNFFLPEINALWLCLLREMASLAGHAYPMACDSERQALDGLSATLARLRESVHAHFKTTFWNEDKGFLNNAVCIGSQLKDDVECEASVMALAFVGRSLFDPQQIARAVACVKETLLVNRWLVEIGRGERPFGIVVKNEPSGPFYGDGQYHGDVVWPRSTPYFIKLLEYCGNHQGIIDDLLLNMLDHQMAEGAVFYAHELFSKPLGRNPDAVPSTERNPVPVKNPLQFWSQWCDPYLEHPLERPSMLGQESLAAALGAVRGARGDERLADPQTVIGLAPVGQASTEGALASVKLPRPRLFVSYARDDKCRKDTLDAFLKLRKTLEALENNHYIEFFIDTRMPGGAEVDRRIEVEILNSRLAVLIVSVSFLASDYITTNELPKLEKRRTEDNCYRVIPIYFAACDYQMNQFVAKLNLVPRYNDKLVPLCNRNPDIDLNELLTQISIEIRQAAEKISKGICT